MARKSRYEINKPKNDKSIWKAGVYIRLSREDKLVKDSMSLSVANQKKIANHFLANNTDIEVVGYFIDDGYTGTDLDRPAFKRLQESFESKMINCIIIKDLSRLARNSEESSKLIYIIFPFFKIRFISINDNVDSYLRPESVQGLEVGFKNIMHDEYARDNSKKVRSALRARKSKGLFLGSFAPYGYKKDGNDKNKLIIDEDVSWVIKYIYNEFINGKNCNQIAKLLTAQKVLPPRAYKDSLGLKYYSPTGIIRKEWSGTTVKTILSSDTYIGNLTQCKNTVISYKNHKIVPSDKSSWISVENTHEPIIDKETFDKVQTILNKKVKSRKLPQKSLFSGYVFCGYCGRALSVAKSVDNKNYLAYYCLSKYNGGNCGFGNRVNVKVIEKTVLGLLNAYLRLYLDLSLVIDGVNSLTRQKSNFEEKIIMFYNERRKLSEDKGTLYLNFKEGNITEEKYLEERDILERKIVMVESKIKECKEREKAETFNLNENNFWQQFVNMKKFKKLTRELLETFIERIDIYSKNRLEIKLKFESELNDTIIFLQENGQDVMELEFA